MLLVSWVLSVYRDNEVVFRRDLHARSIFASAKAQMQWLEFLLHVKHRFECLLSFPAQRQRIGYWHLFKWFTETTFQLQGESIISSALLSPKIHGNWNTSWLKYTAETTASYGWVVKYVYVLPLSNTISIGFRPSGRLSKDSVPEPAE